METTRGARGSAGPSTSHRPDDAASSGDADYLEVAGHARFEVAADAVSLVARVESSQLVADSSALESVPQLSALRARLGEAGAGSVAIAELQGRGKTGLLGGGTEACYRLRIDCPMDSLSAVLRGLAKDKNATLTHAEWSFPRELERERAATAEAARDARSKAEALAAALGVELGLPHRVLHHEWADDPPGTPVPRAKASSGDDVFVRLAARRTLHTKVVLRYRMA